MAYQINKSNLPRKGETLAKVENMEAARLWFERQCENFDCDPELCFDLDPENDAADVAIITKLEIGIYTVEPIA